MFIKSFVQGIFVGILNFGSKMISIHPQDLRVTNSIYRVQLGKQTAILENTDKELVNAESMAPAALNEYQCLLYCSPKSR